MIRWKKTFQLKTERLTGNGTRVKFSFYIFTSGPSVRVCECERERLNKGGKGESLHRHLTTIKAWLTCKPSHPVSLSHAHTHTHTHSFPSHSHFFSFRFEWRVEAAAAATNNSSNIFHHKQKTSLFKKLRKRKKSGKNGFEKISKKLETRKIMVSWFFWRLL